MSDPDVVKPLIAKLRETSRHNSRVLTVGDLNFDIIDHLPQLPELDQEIFVMHRSMTLAGSAGIFTHAIGKLGGDAYFVSKVGDDEGGSVLCEQLRCLGVNIDGVVRVPGGTTAETRIYIDSTNPGRRLMLTLRGVFDELDLRELDIKSYQNRVDVIHLCSYFVLPKLQERIPSLIQQAKGLGLQVSFDANSGDGWGDRQTLDVFRYDIFPFVDYLFLNRHEAACATGAVELEEMLAVLCGWNPHAILTIKLDKEGSCSYFNGQTVFINGFPCKNIQDSVGAGDTFDATFVHFHQKGFSIDEAAILANANARATLEKAGGPTGQCTQTALVDVLSRFCVAPMGLRDDLIRYEITVK